jgi:hypothetical protein
MGDKETIALTVDVSLAGAGNAASGFELTREVEVDLGAPWVPDGWASSLRYILRFLLLLPHFSVPYPGQISPHSLTSCRSSPGA